MEDKELDRLYDVLNLAMAAHEHQERDSGEPYITHPVAVAQTLAGRGYTRFEMQATALLHDVLEDSEIVSPEMIDAIAGPEVLAAVQLLTRRTYAESKACIPKKPAAVYVADIAANPIARTVKMADRMHNLSTLGESGWTRKHIQHYVDDTDVYYHKLADASADHAMGRDLFKMVDYVKKHVLTKVRA